MEIFKDKNKGKTNKRPYCYRLDLATVNFLLYLFSLLIFFLL